MGFSQTLLMLGKLLALVAAFIFVGIPILTGAGIGVLAFLLHLLTGLLLRLLTHPIGLFILGLSVILFMGWRRRRQAAKIQAQAALASENNRDEIATTA